MDRHAEPGKANEPRKSADRIAVPRASDRPKQALERERWRDPQKRYMPAMLVVAVLGLSALGLIATGMLQTDTFNDQKKRPPPSAPVKQSEADHETVRPAALPATNLLVAKNDPKEEPRGREPQNARAAEATQTKDMGEEIPAPCVDAREDLVFRWEDFEDEASGARWSKLSSGSPTSEKARVRCVNRCASHGVHSAEVFFPLNVPWPGLRYDSREGAGPEVPLRDARYLRFECYNPGNEVELTVRVKGTDSDRKPFSVYTKLKHGWNLACVDLDGKVPGRTLTYLSLFVGQPEAGERTMYFDHIRLTK